MNVQIFNGYDCRGNFMPLDVGLHQAEQFFGIDQVRSLRVEAGWIVVLYDNGSFLHQQHHKMTCRTVIGPYDLGDTSHLGMGPILAIRVKRLVPTKSDELVHLIYKDEEDGIAVGTGLYACEGSPDCLVVPDDHLVFFYHGTTRDVGNALAVWGPCRYSARQLRALGLRNPQKFAVHHLGPERPGSALSYAELWIGKFPTLVPGVYGWYLGRNRRRLKIWTLVILGAVLLGLVVWFAAGDYLAALLQRLSDEGLV